MHENSGIVMDGLLCVVSIFLVHVVCLMLLICRCCTWWQYSCCGTAVSHCP